MPMFRKKPVVIEATQWFRHGDEPAESKCQPIECDFEWRCDHCGSQAHKHGNVPTLEGWHIVCPGDWIIKSIKGEFYPCKPDIFEATYEPATDIITMGMNEETGKPLTMKDVVESFREDMQ